MQRERDREAYWKGEAERLHQAKDDRKKIEQWQEYKDRERGKPRSDGSDSSQGEQPPRGNTEDHQVAKLIEQMAAFEADDYHRKPSPDPERSRGPKR